jgi:hypothetical protein
MLLLTCFSYVLADLDSTVWQSVAGTLDTIESSRDFFCGVQTDTKQLWCVGTTIPVPGKVPQWINFPGTWTSADCAGPVITGTNGLTEVNRNDAVALFEFKTTKFNLKQVAVSSDGVSTCGVNESGNVYCANKSLQFIPLQGTLTHVTVQGNQVYGVDGSGAIWYAPDWSRFHGWKKIQGVLQQIDFDGVTLCGVTPGYQIMCANQGLAQKPNWQNVPNPDGERVGYVSVYGQALLITTKSKRIYESILTFDQFNQLVLTNPGF